MQPTSKAPRKLTLHRATVRALGDAELRQVEGGFDSVPPEESGTRHRCDPPIPQAKWQ